MEAKRNDLGRLNQHKDCGLMRARGIRNCFSLPREGRGARRRVRALDQSEEMT